MSEQDPAAAPSSDWQQELVDGVWYSVHPHTQHRLRFDQQKQEWISCDADNVTTTAAADGVSPQSVDERKRHTKNVDNLWVYRDPGTGQTCYFHSTLNQWMPITMHSAGVPAAVVRQPQPQQLKQQQEEEMDDDEDETPKPAEKPAAAVATIAGDDNAEFEYQLSQQQQQSTGSASAETNEPTAAAAAPTVCNRFMHPVSGAEYEWSDKSNDWVPLVDDDFIARYMMSYGVQHDEETVKASVSSLPRMAEFDNENSSDDDAQNKGNETEKERQAREEQEKLAAMTPQEKKDYLKEKKKRAKAEAAEREKNKGWFEDTDNRNVYVSGLPKTIDDKEFEELMAKCGVIDLDPHTRKTKVKLYKTDDGENKGDGRCCYVKRESVDLALQILDGADVKGNRISVQVAIFEMKGQQFDKSKRKKKLTAKQQKRFKEQQQRLFDWHPEKLRGERAKHEKTVVVKNLFTTEELDLNALLLKEIEALLKVEAEKYGTLKKMTIYDTNPDGVATLAYETAIEADDAVKMLDYRVLRGRQLRAATWDGRTKYKMAESQQDAALRARAWADFLEGGESSGDDDSDDSDDDKPKADAKSDAAASAGTKRPVAPDGQSEQAAPEEKKLKTDTTEQQEQPPNE